MPAVLISVANRIALCVELLQFARLSHYRIYIILFETWNSILEMTHLNIDRYLDSIDPVACLLNNEGIIIDVSSGWKSSADANGLQVKNYAIGVNYLRHCVSSDSISLEIFRGLGEVLSGRAPFFGTTYSCSPPGQKAKWFFMAAFGLEYAPTETLVLHLDVSRFLKAPPAGNRDQSRPHDLLLGSLRRVIREEFANFTSARTAPNASDEDRKRLSKLTSRQKQILRLLAQGYSNAQIAERLGIALSSAKSQTALLLRALNCDSRTQAALIGARLGLDQVVDASQL